jgi:hypothetical protein
MIMTYPAYALDIDYELNMLERYFNIYRPMPKEIQEYLKFIPTKRLPLIPEDKEYNAPNQYVRNIPYSPYLCLPCVENYVIVNVYINLPLYKLFLSNPCKKNSKNFLKNYYGVDGSGLESAIGDVNETIITSWLSTNMITTDHYKIIKSLLDVILKKVMVYTDLYPNHIWELDWATSHVILINRGDIKAYRFDELRGLV